MPAVASYQTGIGMSTWATSSWTLVFFKRRCLAFLTMCVQGSRRSSPNEVGSKGKRLVVSNNSNKPNGLPQPKNTKTQRQERRKKAFFSLLSQKASKKSPKNPILFGWFWLVPSHKLGFASLLLPEGTALESRVLRIMVREHQSWEWEKVGVRRINKEMTVWEHVESSLRSLLPFPWPRTYYVVTYCNFKIQVVYDKQ